MKSLKENKRKSIHLNPEIHKQFKLYCVEKDVDMTIELNNLVAEKLTELRRRNDEDKCGKKHIKKLTL